MSQCVWCGDEIKKGLWEIHTCLEEEVREEEKAGR
jgi:hypothetical protein